MSQKESAAPRPTLEEVQARIEAWRKDPTSPKLMPEELWEAAASLSGEYSPHRISKALRLNYRGLKKRIAPEQKKPAVINEPPPEFVELAFGHSPSMAECIVEMEDGSGAKMRMHFRGRTDFDLLELGRAFWRREG